MNTNSRASVHAMRISVGEETVAGDQIRVTP
jgi:hypothetical protein